jgi:glycerol-3-phosphate dehydrogenase
VTGAVDPAAADLEPLPAPLTPPLGPVARRRADLARLASETWDIVIVGGGVVGAGALLDAVSRGMRAALIEQEDLASGTSSRSSRLIHGGVRYLERLHVPLVREALAERRRLLRLAPHLVTLEPLLFPIYGWPVATKAFYDIGLTLYDGLGARHDGGWHRRLSIEDTLIIAPALRRDRLRGGLLYHDGMDDDARYTLAVARTALYEPGDAPMPVVATRVRATGLETDPRSGLVQAVRVTDLIHDEAFTVRTRVVIDATGVWAAERDHPFAGASMRVLPSRGAHLVVPRERIPATAGLTIRVPGKVAFFVPWPDHWLIGTTDAPFDGPPDHPAAAAWEVDELLATVNHVMDVGLTRADVVGTYAGLRPLIAPSSSNGSTVRASREHRVTTERNGVVRIAGGKYTTYRIMARDVVDAAMGALGERRPSLTAERPLIGAAERSALDRVAAELSTIPWLAAVHPEAASRLVDRHGTEAPAVAALAGETGLTGPLLPGRPFLEAEVVWAARHELAWSLDDMLARRTRLAMETPDRAASIAPRVAALLGGELGWDAARQALEVERYLESARREYAVAPAG